MSRVCGSDKGNCCELELNVPRGSNRLTSMPDRRASCLQNWLLLVTVWVVAGNLSAQTGGEVQFVGVEHSTGNGSTLLRVRQAPLEGSIVAMIGEKSSHLVVCGGQAFWAASGPSGTRLYRSRTSGSGVDLLGQSSGANASTTQLVTDGRVVYWSIRTDSGGCALFRFFASDVSSQFAYVAGFRGVAKDLVVENQEAFWAVETASGVTVYRFGRTIVPPAFSLTGVRFAGMALDSGKLWIMVNRTSPVRAVVVRYHLGKRVVEDVHDVTGEGGEIKATGGRGVWVLAPPGGAPLQLFRCAVESNTPTQFAVDSAGMTSSRGLVLTDRQVAWWGSSGSTAVCAFFPRADAPPANIFRSTDTQIDSVIGFGEDFWMATRATSGSSPAFLRFFELGASGSIGETRTLESPAPARALQAGRWHMLAAQDASLFATDRQGGTEVVGIPDSASTQIATGEAQTSSLFFAANANAEDRRLFSVSGGGVSGNFSFPKNMFVWDDKLWFTARAADPIRQLISGSLVTQSFTPSILPMGANPSEIREFKGRLYVEGDLASSGNGTVARGGLFLNRLAIFSPLGNGPIAAPPRPLLDYQGLAFFPSSTLGGLTAASLTAPDKTIYLPVPSVANPDISGLVGWQDTVFGHVGLQPGGGRVMFRYPIGSGTTDFSTHVMTADAFGPLTACQDRLYFVAKSGTSETVYSLNSGDSAPNAIQQMPPVGLLGLQNLRGFVRYGSRLFGIADGYYGSQLVVLSGDSFSTTSAPDPFGSPTVQLFSFQGLLFAATGGTNGNVYWGEGSGWAPVSSTPLADASEFTEYAGSIFFTAGASGQRQLYRLTGPTLEKVSPGTSGAPTDFNPRGLTLHRDMLYFSGNSWSSGIRELWQFNDFRGTGLVMVSNIGNSFAPANPIVDGPRNIQLSFSSLPNNLPAGVTVGTVSAASDELLGPLSYSLVDAWPSAQFSSNGTVVQLARSTAPFSGSPLLLTVRATNRWGIASTSTFSISIVDNRQAWVAANFLGRENDPAISGPESDPDNDGIKNLMEFALGLNPNDGNGSNGAGGLPVGSMELSAPARLKIAFQRPLAFPSGLRYTVESSFNLREWSQVGMMYIDGGGTPIWTGAPGLLTEIIREADGRVECTVRDSADVTIGTARFLRLRVTLQ